MFKVGDIVELNTKDKSYRKYQVVKSGYYSFTGILLETNNNFGIINGRYICHNNRYKLVKTKPIIKEIIL